MRDDDGFTAAEGWIDQWQSGVAAHAARADALARRLAALDGGDGSGTATIGKDTIGKDAIGKDAVEAAVAETVGLDSELGRAVLAAYG